MEKETLEGNNIVLWVGDEISKANPTNLPTRQELMETLIEVSCGKATLENINKKIEHLNEFTKQVNHSVGGNVYMENIIRDLGKIKAVNLYTGITSFLNVSYNSYHCYLALLLEHGVSIVTPNYDMCIEKAYESLTEGKDKLELINSHNGVYCYSGKNKKTGTVFHIHGTADNPKDIGANLGMGEEYFSEVFRKEIDRWIQEGCKVYFVAYPAKDVYDVTVYLMNRVKQFNKPLWSGYYVTTGYRKDLKQREKKLLGLFEKNEVIRMTNIEFLIDLSMGVTSLSRQEIENSVFHLMKYNKEERGGWKEWVYPHYIKAQPYKSIILLRINQTLGIHVEDVEPEIFNHLNQMPDSSRNMYQSLIVRYRYDYMSSYGYVIRSQEELSQEERLFEEELICLCNDKYNKENHQIHQLSIDAERLILEYMNWIRCNNDESKWVEEAKKSLDTINLLLAEKEGNKTNDIPRNYHQTDAILYRLRAAMRAVLEKEDKELALVNRDLSKSFFYSQQTANLVAFCKTMDFAGYCYLCFYYKGGKKKKGYYDKSQKFKILQKRFRQ